MFDDNPRPPYIQRCTYTELRGRRHWQCLLQDPHPQRGHQLPIDARFGQPLHEMHPEKLAALLRDHVALVDNLQGRLDGLQAIALQLAAGWAGDDGSRRGRAAALPEATVKWLRANSPAAAERLGVNT